MSYDENNLALEAVEAAAWAVSRMGTRTDEAAADVRSAAQAVENAVNESSYCASAADPDAGILTRAAYWTLCQGWTLQPGNSWADDVQAALANLSTYLTVAGDGDAAEAVASSSDALGGFADATANVLDPSGGGDWWGVLPGWMQTVVLLGGLYVASRFVRRLP